MKTTKTTQRSTVVGVFEDRRKANDAVQALRQAGFRDDQIGVAGKFAEGADAAAGTDTETGSKWEEGAVTGVLTGAGLGALVGLGIMAGVIPVLGPVIAGGTLAMLAANAAGGAAIAGLVGALVGAGIPEEEARYYESEFHSGRTIVTVNAEGRADEATTILRSYGAYDMHSAGTAATTTASAATATTTGRATAATAGTGKIRVHEEQVTATKTPVETGEVRVRKEVVTEHKTLEVPVQREEVVIERHPVSGHATTGETIHAGEEIRIPVREEEVHVSKQTVAKEEVSVGKRVVTGTEHVAADVRKEQVKIEREGDVDVHGTTGTVSDETTGKTRKRS